MAPITRTTQMIGLQKKIKKTIMFPGASNFPLDPPLICNA